MKITDETLSAFLDRELPEAEMQAVRQSLSEDQTLSDRLAELAAADQMVASRYAAIDERPLPDSLKALLAHEEQPSAQVIAFPLWKRVHQSLQEHAAMAAGIALAIGLGLGQLVPGGTDGKEWEAVAQGLENTPSGTTVELASGERLTPRLTFMNRQGEYCRQYRLTRDSSASENIACRTQDAWQLTATVHVDAVQQDGSYQTASGGSLLDSTLDQMIASEVFDAQAEQEAMNQNWKP